MHNKWVKLCWNKGSILHTNICIYILYQFCIQIVFIMFMMYTFWPIRIDLYKTYTKCLYTKCNPHYGKLLYWFCIQNLAGIVLLILCTKYFVYKFSWHSSFDFVYKKLVEMSYTFCIHFVYISCIHLVQFLYTKCMYTVSVWDGDSSKILILI